MAAEGLAALTAEKGLLAGVAELVLHEVGAPGKGLAALVVPTQVLDRAELCRNIFLHWLHADVLSAASVLSPHAVCALVQIAWALRTVGVLFGGSEAVPLWCCIWQVNVLPNLHTVQPPPTNNLNSIFYLGCLDLVEQRSPVSVSLPPPSLSFLPQSVSSNLLLSLFVPLR